MSKERLTDLILMKTDRKYRLVLLCWSWIVLSTGLLAQDTDIISRYNHALIQFELGRIDSAYQIMKGCIRDKQAMRIASKESRGGIYKLAAEAAILLELFEEAEMFTRKLRMILPHYQAREDDLPEFKALLQNTRIYPKNIFSLTFIGPNTKPEMIRNLSPFTPEGKYSERKDNNTLGIQYKRFLNPNISVGIGMHYGMLVEMTFEGTYLPLKEAWYYYANIPVIEWPVVIDYNLYVTKNVIGYYELGLSYVRPVNPIEEYGRGFSVERSERFGKYYSYSSTDPDGYDPLVSRAFFFETPLDYNFIIGTGGLFRIGNPRFKDLWFEIGVRYFPKIVRRDPFENVVVFDDIPEEDPLYYYDDIFLVRIKNHFQMVVTFGINLSYGAR